MQTRELQSLAKRNVLFMKHNNKKMIYHQKLMGAGGMTGSLQSLSTAGRD
jgi:hypothetical protein